MRKNSSSFAKSLSRNKSKSNSRESSSKRSETNNWSKIKSKPKNIKRLSHRNWMKPIRNRNLRSKVICKSSRRRKRESSNKTES